MLENNTTEPRKAKISKSGKKTLDSVKVKAVEAVISLDENARLFVAVEDEQGNQKIVANWAQ